jgi:hypothetical protein
MAKAFPGSVDAQYIAQGHTIASTSKATKANYYLPAMTATNGYVVILYCPTAVANNSSRWSGLTINTAATPTSTFTATSLPGTTMSTVYGGDFNLYS